ncbi:venom serine carboxypeptidase-like [Bradysia coprophila]|uniref:venom serine carboxypeptidase-like n=1 Tax=Bradysia coprophila TaxID=38358 RepID=UPI00187DCEE6|nr:venom serine carboxypeptidase-like [Bradysia coprophila]
MLKDKLKITWKFFIFQTLLVVHCCCDSRTESNTIKNEPLFLTPLIKAGKISEAQDAARVQNLVVSDHSTAIVSFSGFLTVQPEYNSNLFFWFVPCQNNPQDKPLILWLQGGPGESALYGLFTEHGPFKIDSSLKKLNYRNESWTTTHSMLYLDSPVGAGFSFTEGDNGYARNENDVARNVYDGLLQFFKLFPEYRARDFFVAGESYGGKYVPAVSHKIHSENDQLDSSSENRINLKGLAMGNAFTDPVTTINYGTFLYDLGLIDYHQLHYFKQEEEKARNLIKEAKFVEAFDTMDKLFLGSKNTSIPSYFTRATGYNSVYNILRTNDPDDMLYFKDVLQNQDDDEIIRPFIHVGDRTFQHFDLGGPVAQHLEEDIYQSVKNLVEDLLNAKCRHNVPKYKIMYYTGALDVCVGVPLINKLIENLNGWDRLDTFQETQKDIWYFDREQKIIAGYFKSYSGLTHAVVRNAGHRVPYDQPEWALDMIGRFTNK